MRRSALLVAVLAAGCGGSNYPVKRVESPVNVTHEVAFGDYRRVFNTAYHIVNRYGVVQTSSYRYGEISALVGEDNHLFDKTRREILARIFDAGDYFEVECQVLLKVEDSDVATFPDQFQPRYSWKTVARDPFLETRLNNEIRAALSGGAWSAKEPLTPTPRVPATDPKPVKPAKQQKADEGKTADTEEVRVRPSRPARVGAGPGAEAFARLGVVSLRQGAFERAEAAFVATLEADQKDPFAGYLLAQARFSRGDWSGADKALRAAARRNPAWRDLDVRGLYGEGDVTFGRQLAALEAASRTDASLAVLLGYMRLGSHDATGALAALDQAPDDALAQAWRARAVAAVDEARGLEEF